MTAVMAVGGTTAGDLLERGSDASRAAEKTYRNPHKKPAPIPLRDVAKVFGYAKATHNREREGFSLARPGLAPRFEWDAVCASRLRHAFDLTRDPGSVLGRGRSTERIHRSRTSPFLRFGSGTFRSGPSSPLFA